MFRVRGGGETVGLAGVGGLGGLGVPLWSCGRGDLESVFGLVIAAVLAVLVGVYSGSRVLSLF